MNINLRNKLLKTIEGFDPIHLNQMSGVRLMSRMDTKYVFNVKKLPEILDELTAIYLMLEIDNVKEQIYETMYFDSSAYDMYTTHHNGKLNRYKVRVRKYASTQEKFLEVKFKNNKKRTIKKRIRNKENYLSLSENQYQFIEENTTFRSCEMHPSLKNSFTRLTLVNKDLGERITIDYKLWFQDPVSGNETTKENICIVEVKKEGGSAKSVFEKVLEKNRIQSMGFSKYCMGIAFTNTKIKRNRFKQRIKKLDKLIYIN